MIGRVVWTCWVAVTTLLWVSSCLISGMSLSSRMSALPMAMGPKRLPPDPGKMVSMLEPMFWIRAMEARLEPSPMPIMAATRWTAYCHNGGVRWGPLVYRFLLGDGGTHHDWRRRHRVPRPDAG